MFHCGTILARRETLRKAPGQEEGDSRCHIRGADFLRRGRARLRRRGLSPPLRRADQKKADICRCPAGEFGGGGWATAESRPFYCCMADLARAACTSNLWRRSPKTGP